MGSRLGGTCGTESRPYTALPPKKNTPVFTGVFDFDLERILVALGVAAAAFAAAAATATTTTTAAAERSARAATGAIFARTRFIHRERTTLHRFAVHEADSFLRFFRTRHRDEGESAGFAREFILHQSGFRDCSRFREKVLEIDLRGVEGKISYVEFR